MLSWLALVCLVGALGVLLVLSIIDLKTRLLPNEWVLGFAVLGIVFHICTKSAYASPADIALGAAEGFLSLFLLRAVANRLYDADTLGLGDVKLMGAAGLWLGPDVMIAMAAGAFVSLIHGFVIAALEARKNGGGLNLSGLSLPAGPGFACGIVLAGLWKFAYFRPDLFWEHA
jgi:leader peptidase (prepilin peptidase)/N-methyltransferase